MDASSPNPPSSDHTSGVRTDRLESRTDAVVAESPPPSPRGGRRGRCVGGRGRSAATWGSSSTVGGRREMEDAVAIIPDLADLACEYAGGCSVAARGASGTPRVRFFGIFDGHGGAQVADYCARRMHEIILEEWRKLDGEDGWKRRWETTFVNGFDKIDDEISSNCIASDMVGTTALVVVLSGCQIIVSNCGDSRAILCRGSKAIQLTVDHKPDNKSEFARIEAGGGRVVDWQGLRVSGILAVSRAIGDQYLRPWIIPVPETTFTPRTEDDECLILASDGLWDVVSNDEVREVACRLLRRQRRNGVVDVEAQSPAQVAADHLVKLAYSKSSSDNISTIVIDLKCRATRRQQRTRT